MEKEKKQKVDIKEREKNKTGKKETKDANNEIKKYLGVKKTKEGKKKRKVKKTRQGSKKRKK